MKSSSEFPQSRRRAQAIRFCVAIFVCGLSAISGGALCQGAEPEIQLPSYNQFTVDDEARIGAALTHDFESRQEVVSNVLLDKYLSDLAARLGKASRRADLTYTCKVIDSRDVNAY